jgi:hypothetical protein
MAGSGPILSQPLIVTDSTRDPNDPLKNRRYSAWDVLINSNVSKKTIPNWRYRAIVHRLNLAWEEMFGPTPPDINMFQSITPDKFPFLSPPDNNPYFIWRIPSDPRFPPPKASSRKGGEVGTKFHKIHVHGEFRVIHYGNLRLNYDEMRTALKGLVVGDGDLGIDNPYVKFTYRPDRQGDELYLKKGREELRDQTDNELGPISDIDAEEEAYRRAASNSTSSGLRPQDVENDDDQLIFDNNDDSDDDDDLLPTPPPPPPPQPQVYNGPHAVRETRSGREYGGEVMPRSQYRSRRRRGKK